MSRKAACFFGTLLLLFLSNIASGATIYVPDDHTTIQDALQAAVDGDTILVRPGTYVENVDFVGKNVVLRSELGPEVTVIDGSMVTSVVIFQTGEGPDAVLDGFSITNGLGALEPGGTRNGGGIAIADSSPTIVNNIIRENHAERGGGIMCSGSSSLISNNTFTQNTAESGGGIFNYNKATPMISGNLIEENASTATAGGINTVGAHPVIMGNLIKGNTVAFGGDGGGMSFHLRSDNGAVINNVIVANAVPLGAGGGIYCFQSSPKIEGNIIAGNICFTGGGGIRISWKSNNVIANNTVVNNTASEGGGIWCNNSDPTVANMILWNNSANQGKEIHVGSQGSPSIFTISYSDVEGGQGSVHVDPSNTLNWGASMIDSDPLFVDADHYDFHLTYTSPCMDAGDASFPDLPDEDYEGDPRIHNLVPDMGGDEFHHHLYQMGAVIPGMTIDVRIIGAPGAPRVILALGQGVLDPPRQTALGLLYLDLPPVMHADLGVMPAEGFVNFSMTVPISWTSGNEYPVQALVGPFLHPRSNLTNLMLLEVE